MYFKATDEQVKAIAALACNAAQPVGAGWIHYQANRLFTTADFKIETYNTLPRELSLDYVQGRQGKLCIVEDAGIPGIWIITRGDNPHPEYQSWCHRYPTEEAIIKAAGIAESDMNLTRSMIP
jgi:hypothetical protein